MACRKMIESDKEALARMNGQYFYRLLAEAKRLKREAEEKLLKFTKLDDAEWEGFRAWHKERYCGSEPNRSSVELWLSWKKELPGEQTEDKP